MELQNLDAFTSELQKQRSVVHQKATALRSNLWSVEKELARIDAALVALSGEAIEAESNRQTATRSKRTLQTPSAKKADVIAAIRKVLEIEEAVPADALKKQVEDLLTKNGFNRFGFAMRWKEAVQDQQFTVSKEGVRLFKETSSYRTATSCDYHGESTSVAITHPTGRFTTMSKGTGDLHT